MEFQFIYEGYFQPNARGPHPEEDQALPLRGLDSDQNKIEHPAFKGGFAIQIIFPEEYLY